MFDQIHGFFQFLGDRLGLHPVAIVVFVVVLVLPHVLFELYLFLKLKRAREIMARLAERLGYEPPYGDGEAILEEESHREIVERDKDEQIEQLEQHLADLEAESQREGSDLAAYRRRAKDLEDQLQQAAIKNDEAKTRLAEQSEAHRATLEQLEQHIRDVETESEANVAEQIRRSKELTDQLEQAALWNDRATALSNDQAQAHRRAMEQVEQRIRDMETAHNAELTALQRRAKELEGQLQQALANSTQKDAEIAEADVAKAEIAKAGVSLSRSEEFLRRAEQIMSRAVGAILLHGLVAAEAYASAALAADPQNTDASQLLAELARIHRAYPEGLPSVVEAVTTFDEKATAYFAADPARAAEIAGDEAQRRSRAGLNRSALLVTDVALDLRQKTDPQNDAALRKLQEMKASLLARLGN